MKKVKKGDLVTRKSYDNDIIFYVKRIIKLEERNIAILDGLTKRLEADSDINDLEIVDNRILKNEIKKEQLMIKKINKNRKKEENLNRDKAKIKTGTILHLDGDRKYSQKSTNYYKKMGLSAIVKNIPESEQPKFIYELLMKYNPDILVITGHDRYDKKRTKL